MIPPSTVFAVREAVILLRASRRNFKSRQVEQARALLEKLLELEGIRRLSTLFADGTTSDFFDYPNTIVTDVVESGFREGTKIKKTHVTIERNAGLRKEFFAVHPTAICDVCLLDTAKTYPWTERVMDIHHLLPLSSGTRVEASGTTFADLRPVCPSCHRAIHRYYDGWLIQNNRKDFKDGREALGVYQAVKNNFPGIIHA